MLLLIFSVQMLNFVNYPLKSCLNCSPIILTQDSCYIHLHKTDEIIYAATIWQTVAVCVWVWRWYKFQTLTLICLWYFTISVLQCWH